jgi:hypothetical protein
MVLDRLWYRTDCVVVYSLVPAAWQFFSYISGELQTGGEKRMFMYD